MAISPAIHTSYSRIIDVVKDAAKWKDGYNKKQLGQNWGEGKERENKETFTVDCTDPGGSQPTWNRLTTPFCNSATSELGFCEGALFSNLLVPSAC